jgi:hypothetical protein
VARLSPSAARALRAAGSVTAIVRLAAVDRAGNRATTQRQVTLAGHR